MKHRRNLVRWLAVLLAFGLVAAACGDDDDAGPAEAPITDTDTPDDDIATAPSDGTAAAPSDDTAAAPTTTEPALVVEEGELSGVCPSPLVVQTDWFPESEHGAMYHLIGDGYTVDAENQVVQGPMVLDGTDLGIDFQIRTGGPAIGFAPVSSYMYTDESIHMGYASTDAQILQYGDAPLVAVVAPLEQNPQMIMWDPELANVDSIADLGREGVTVNVFGGGVFPQVFVAQGIWNADQVDPSYDGSPARFVSEGGAIAQQGFASSEVYTYEHIYEEWGRPVEFQLLHDAGFQIYSQTLGVRPRDMDTLRPCLERVVPIFQQAVISFDASPGGGNAVIVDAVEQYASFWVYPPELADFSVQAQRDYGLIGNGPDSVVGNMEADRIQGLLDAILATDLAADVADGLTAGDLFTNEFIDENIGFPEMAEEEMVAVDLSGVCPSPLAVQTDWFPEAEHGALYHLIGDGYTVDTENQVVQGPMVLDGTDLGIEFQIRTGGPAIGFAPVSSYMYTDESIHLGYASSDAQILQYGDAPLVSVVAPLEKNPQMIMWDPETYPNVDSIADLGTEEVTVNVFGGGVFPQVFVAQGIWSADQVDPSYDGSPARFVSEGGAVAQQGFASAEVYTYEHTFEEWGKPVAFELLHDSGFQIYSQTIGVRPRDMDSLRPCLERVVPIIQQAVVSYDASPDGGNAVIVDAVEQYASFWVYPPELAEFSVNAQREYGLIGNGPDSTVGNMEEARYQGVLDAILATDLASDVADGLTAGDLFTNEFIDESIGF